MKTILRIILRENPGFPSELLVLEDFRALNPYEMHFLVHLSKPGAKDLLELLHPKDKLKDISINNIHNNN